MRVEQLYPFPRKPLKTELSRFPGAEIVWCQEEPKNMGAWTGAAGDRVGRWRDMGLKQQRLRYVGRAGAASPATGLLRRHLKEQAELVEDALVIRRAALQSAARQ